jgi:cell division protein FtsW
MNGSDDTALLSSWWRSLDRTLLALIACLAVCGILVAFVATPQAAIHYKLEPFYFAKRHGIAMAIALGIMAVVSYCGERRLRRLALALFFIGLAGMALALLQGAERNGAIRWLYVMGAVIQPSEFVKPGFVALTAWLLAESVKRPDMPALELALACLAAFVTLLALQPDIGQSVIAVAVWAGLFFLCGYPLRLAPIVGGICVGGLVLAYATMPHFAKRIDRFTGHASDSHQTVVASNAFRDAGWFGHGLGEGFQRQRLPDAHNDFVFASVAEELGIAACLFLIAIYGLIVLRAWVAASREDDLFIKLAISGLAMVFGFQALVNMAVNVNLLPAKGVTLPFLSYGRSSLISSAITLGMLLALTRKRTETAQASAAAAYASDAWVAMRGAVRGRLRRRAVPGLWT